MKKEYLVPTIEILEIMEDVLKISTEDSWAGNQSGGYAGGWFNWEGDNINVTPRRETGRFR